jgi:hypothetical protein
MTIRSSAVDTDGLLEIVSFEGLRLFNFENGDGLPEEFPQGLKPGCFCTVYVWAEDRTLQSDSSD